MNANLADIAEDIHAIRLLLEDGYEEEEEERGDGGGKKAPRADLREGFERSQRKLADRIAFYEARIAARERGEGPDAAAT